MKFLRGTRPHILAESAACLVVVFGVVSLIWSLGAMAGRDAESAETSRQTVTRAASHSVTACDNLRASQRVACLYDALESTVQREHERSDLVAQNRAAWGAIIAGTTGFLTLIVTAVGLIYIAGTLSETRASNRRGMKELARARLESRRASAAAAASLAASEASAVAAHRQAEIADGMARRQLRPYLTITDVSVTSVGSDNIWVALSIKNQGVTPAHIRSFSAIVWLGPMGSIDPWADGPPPPIITSSHKQIYSIEPVKQSVWAKPCDPSTVSKTGNDLYVYGRIEYTDSFGDDHWLNFAFIPPGYQIESELKLRPALHGNISSL